MAEVRTHEIDDVALALDLLRERHERISRARQAVIEVMAEARAHLTAEEIEQGVIARAPGVHRATVYRTLSTLSEVGIVRHMHVGGGRALYRLAVGEPDDAAPTMPRAHAQCTSCGRLFDVPADAVDRLSDRLLDELGFALEPHHAALLGICAECRSAD